MGQCLSEHFQEKDMLTAEQQLPSRGLGTAELWHWEAQGAARSSRTGDRILPQAVAADRQAPDFGGFSEMVRSLFSQ